MSDAVVDALAEAGVPSDAAQGHGWHANVTGEVVWPDEHEARAIIATDLDAIGLVAAAHASPTARAAMLRVLLEWFRDDQRAVQEADRQVALALVSGRLYDERFGGYLAARNRADNAENLLSLLAPEGPPEVGE